MWEKIWIKGNSSMAGGNANLYIHFGYQYGVHQKTGNQHTIRLSHITLGLKDAQLYHKDTCATMFEVAFVVINRTWKLDVHLMSNVLKKCDNTYTMEYYIAVKNRDTRKFEGKWTKLEKIIFPSLAT